MYCAYCSLPIGVLEAQHPSLLTMTPIPLHTSASRELQNQGQPNPLPTLLHTPAGLAIIELQGTINLPSHSDVDAITTEGRPRETPIGRLVFPDYVEGTEGQAWMKRVYMYVGKHQRLTGEVKKLPRAMAVIRRRTDGVEPSREDGEGEELEIVEIIKFKIVFATRPEPVGAQLPGP